MACGCWMLSTLDFMSRMDQIVGYQILAGFGVGMVLELPFVSNPAVFR